MRSALILPVALSLSCRPPDAPVEYEELVSYIFEHAADDDDAALLAGLENLTLWLSGENLEAAEDGMTISNLSSSAAAELEGHAHTTDGLAGVSMVTNSVYDGSVLMDALTQYSFKTIIPDVYLEYDRTFDEGVDCIVSRECLWADGSVYSLSDWGILGNVEAERRIEFRWVETDMGWVFLQRWWLTEPSVGDTLGLVIEDQYYIGVNFPMSSGTQRVHASWLKMTTNTGDFSEGAANQLIDNWKKDSESLDLWISENL